MEEFDESVYTQQSLALNSNTVTSDEIIKTNRMLRLIKGRCFFIFSKSNQDYRKIHQTSADKVNDYSTAVVQHVTNKLRESHFKQSNFLWKLLDDNKSGKEIALKSIGGSKQLMLTKNIKDLVETALSVEEFSKKEKRFYNNYTKSCSTWKNLTDMNDYVIVENLDAEIENEMLDPDDIAKIKSTHQKELNRLKKLTNSVQKLMSAFKINYMIDEEMREILERVAYVNHIYQEYA